MHQVVTRVKEKSLWEAPEFGVRRLVTALFRGAAKRLAGGFTQQRLRQVAANKTVTSHRTSKLEEFS